MALTNLCTHTCRLLLHPFLFEIVPLSNRAHTHADAHAQMHLRLLNDACDRRMHDLEQKLNAAERRDRDSSKCDDQPQQAHAIDAAEQVRGAGCGVGVLCVYTQKHRAIAAE